MKDLAKLAEAKEREGAESGKYPPNWPEVARQVKEEEGWCCERCNVPHGNVPNVLTVHHLDGNKWNLERWNLAALCQRCHLRVQAKVIFYQIHSTFVSLRGEYEPRMIAAIGVHSPWMARHVWWYNLWAIRMNRPQLPLSLVLPRNYQNEWEGHGYGDST